MENFSQRFVIIYKKFVETRKPGEATSKLAFSRFIGVSQGRMQEWEKGQIPKGVDLKNIHDKLGFDYGWLISGEGNPFGAQGEKSAREAALEAENAELREKLKKADDINRNLTARLFIEGAPEEDIDGKKAAQG